MSATQPISRVERLVRCTGCGQHAKWLTIPVDGPTPEWLCRVCAGYTCPDIEGCTIDHRDDDGQVDAVHFTPLAEVPVGGSEAGHRDDTEHGAEIQLEVWTHVEGWRPHPTLVEVTIPQNAGCENLCLLTGPEAVALGEQLVAAGKAASSDNARNPARGTCAQCDYWREQGKQPTASIVRDLEVRQDPSIVNMDALPDLPAEGCARGADEVVVFTRPAGLTDQQWQDITAKMDRFRQSLIDQLPDARCRSMR